MVGRRLVVRRTLGVVAAVFCVHVATATRAVASFEIAAQHPFLTATPGATAPRDLAVVDLDEDGHPDIAVSQYNNGSEGNVSVLWGDGTGNFSAPDVWGVGIATLIAAGDIDGDGHADLVADQIGSGHIYWGNGTRNPAGQLLLSSEGGAGLAIADIDGDGDNDVVAAQGSDHVTVYYNDGQRSFHSVQYTGVPSINDLRVAQLDGKYGLDILVTGFWSSSLGLLFNDGQGGFPAPVVLPGGTLTSDVALGEFTGDAHLDILYARRGCFSDPEGTCPDDGVTVLAGDGSGGFTQYAAWDPGGEGPMGAAERDLNGDGRMDAVVTNYNSNNLVVLLGKSGGGLDQLPLIPVDRGPAAVAIADVNHDACPDILTANWRSTSVSVLLVTGCTGQVTPTPTPTLHIGAPVHFPAGDAADIRTRDVAVADFDEDGHPDIAVTNFGGPAPQVTPHTGSVSVLWGDGTGAFSPAQIWYINDPEPCCPNTMAVGEIDGDGHIDIVADYRGLRVFWGSGTRTPPAWQVLSTAYGNAPTLADIDGDGDTDVITARDGVVEIFYNDGQRAFHSAQYAGLSSVGDIAAAQLDGADGLDLVESALYSSQLGFLFADGSGGFQSLVAQSAGTLTTDMALGDFTGDGTLDIFYAHRGCIAYGPATCANDGVAVLAGDGHGSFSPYAAWDPGGEGPIGVASGDLNGDGRTDVVVTNYNSGNIAVLLGKAVGGLEQLPLLSVGAGPIAAAVADLNHDHCPDIVTGNWDGASVSVLLVSGCLGQTTPTPGPSDCCQGSNACGPPNDGQCQQGAQPVFGAFCDGMTGHCVAFTPTPTPTPTITPTPTSTRTTTATLTSTPTTPPADCCQVGALCGPPSNGECAAGVPKYGSTCDGAVGQCVTFTPTPTATPTRPACNICGDANGDGHVDVVDALFVSQLSVQLRTTLPCANVADVNGDGSVNSVDALFISQHTVNLRPTLNCATPTPTPAPTVCPFVFTDAGIPSGESCVYRGRWNASCGTDQLRATWTSAGSNLLAVISSDPPGYFCATVTSSTTATITGWTTDASCRQPMPLAGTIALGANSLVISPATPPFALDGCNFEQYLGLFESVSTP